MYVEKKGTNVAAKDSTASTDDVGGNKDQEAYGKVASASVGAATNTTTSLESNDDKKRKRQIAEEGVTEDTGCNCTDGCLEVRGVSQDGKITYMCNTMFLLTHIIYFCYQHTCPCFVQGKFCNSSSCCNCSDKKVPDDETIESQKEISSCYCQNNDNESNIDIRKERLIQAMQNHPEQFWMDTTKEKMTIQNQTPPPKLALTFDTIAAKDDAAEKEDFSDVTKNLEPQILAVWKDVQTMITQKIRSFKNDDDRMDIDDKVDGDGRNDDGFDRIQLFLRKIQNEQEEGEDDIIGADGGVGTKTTSDIASKVLRSVSKDLAKIIQSVKSSTNGPNFTTSVGTSGQDRHSSEFNDGNVVDESTTLLCSEEFPESASEASGGVGDDDDQQYVQNLINETTFAQTVENDPKFICYEEGLFEGDDGSQLLNEEELLSSPNKKEEILAAQKLALIQETTRLIRTKTLELTKRRLQKRKS
jgi:hypothetical protein